jgi:hypothetical protein
MLEYLQVPSPFVGTETVLDPIKFGLSGTHLMPANVPSGPVAGEASISGGSEVDGTAGLHPPFNTVSNYRDPGKVNINTIADPQAGAVWNAIRGTSKTNDTAVGGPAFSTDVALSRQGYAGTLYQFDDKHPSIFSNPFRAPGGADMVPLTASPTDLRQKPVNVTIWRAEGANPDVSSTGTPLLAKNLSSQAYNNYQRNPYFYFEGMGRMANKITTRSNVYAVWVTVGYFEVTPWQGNPAVPNGPMVIDTGHPDGYQLGQELGADTGEIERHRGFYIIDRSIPVGFQRGVDNNVNNAVILKRFIE